LIKGSIEPDTAITVKGVSNPKEIIALLKERYISKG
jgi:hypothetical protein